MDVKDWIEKEKLQRKPKISDFKSDILFLKENGFTNKDVKRYLEEVKKYVVSEAYIGRYIKQLNSKDGRKDESKKEKEKEAPKNTSNKKKLKMEEFFKRNNNK